jgi:hypothetical protein
METGPETAKQGDANEVQKLSPYMPKSLANRGPSMPSHDLMTPLPLNSAPPFSLPEKDFWVKLRKTPPDAGVGLFVDTARKTYLVVSGVEGGAAAAWNYANPDREVRAGDRIMSVNRVSGDAKNMIKVCKTDTVLDMFVRRFIKRCRECF